MQREGLKRGGMRCKACVAPTWDGANDGEARGEALSRLRCGLMRGAKRNCAAE